MGAWLLWLLLVQHALPSQKVAFPFSPLEDRNVFHSLHPAFPRPSHLTWLTLEDSCSFSEAAPLLSHCLASLKMKCKTILVIDTRFYFPLLILLVLPKSKQALRARTATEGGQQVPGAGLIYCRGRFCPPPFSSKALSCVFTHTKRHSFGLQHCSPGEAQHGTLWKQPAQL